MFLSGVMRKKTLPQKFFQQDTVRVAQALLGKFLLRKRGDAIEAYMIIETEAYDGSRDRGSHASRGETKRNAPMFGAAGQWYVYFTYGMHWMLNVVTREKGYPAAVLVRGVVGANGPARLTKKLAIDGRMNNLSATRRSKLWIEDRGIRVQKKSIKKSPRVGIDYAGPYWAKRKLRFSIYPTNIPVAMEADFGEAKE